MTRLNKPVSRVTARKIGKRHIVVTIAPLGNQDESLIAMRLLGTRTTYVAAVSNIYRLMALWHGQKEAAARRAARKMGIPWKTAKKQFTKENSIPNV